MALQDEQADILGGPILQKPVSGFFSTFSQHYTVIKAAALLGLGLLVWIACIRGYEQLKKSRELGYRKYACRFFCFLKASDTPSERCVENTESQTRTVVHLL
jgi:hypothetical protein